ARVTNGADALSRRWRRVEKAQNVNIRQVVPALRKNPQPSHDSLAIENQTAILLRARRKRRACLVHDPSHPVSEYLTHGFSANPLATMLRHHEAIAPNVQSAAFLDAFLIGRLAPLVAAAPSGSMSNTTPWIDRDLESSGHAESRTPI